MEHIFFRKLGLLLIKRENGYSLFDVVSGFSLEGFKTEPVKFLPKVVSELEIMEKAKLILTQYQVYSLNGQVLMEKFGEDKLFVSELENNWAICLKDKFAQVKKLIIWNGKKAIRYYEGFDIIFNEKNVIVKDTRSVFMKVYHEGKLQNLSPISSEDISLYGDTLLINYAGKDTAYCINTGKIICEGVNVLCSQDGEFLLYSDSDNNFSSYYKNKWTKLGKYEFKCMDEKEKIFCLSNNGKCNLFKFDGTQIFADADEYSLDDKSNSMLITAGKRVILLPC